MSTNIPAEKAALVMNTLKDQANKIVSSGNNISLDMYHSESAGNFPYNYEDDDDLVFNSRTYRWINKCVQARKEGEPITIGDDYNMKYQQVMTKINYNQSAEDQAILSEATKKTEAQKRNLVKKWRDAKLKLPADQIPIDAILFEVRTKWATKEGTTLQDLQNAPDLYRLLANAPTSGAGLIPDLSKFLTALGDAISVVNDQTLNDGILASVRTATNFPTEGNGGIKLDDDDKTFYPAYRFATNQEDVLEGLGNKNTSVEIKMKMTEISNSETSLSVGGEASFKMPLGFLDIDLGAEASYFTKVVTKKSRIIDIDMVFKGITVVQFGPEDFLLSSRKGWHHTDAIKKAIANGDKDITGFQFAPKPNIDFGKNGDFGFINTVAICQYPEITIKVFSSDYKKIETDLKAAANADAKVKFLGIEMGLGLEGSYGAKTEDVNETEGSITFKMSPPIDTLSGSNREATAFILGVQAKYPAS